MSRYRSPVKTARGLGSAKHGTGHFLAQRFTAVALVPLALWFVVSLLYTVLTADYGGALLWIHRPWNTLLLVLLIGTVFYHSTLGLQVVIEDYVHTTWRKAVALVALRMVNFVVATAGILAVLQIAFIGV